VIRHIIVIASLSEAFQTTSAETAWIASSLALLAMTIAMATAFQTPVQITFKTL
jgi:hypothetical protein